MTRSQRPPVFMHGVTVQESRRFFHQDVDPAERPETTPTARSFSSAPDTSDGRLRPPPSSGPGLSGAGCSKLATMHAPAASASVPARRTAGAAGDDGHRARRLPTVLPPLNRPPRCGRRGRPGTGGGGSSGDRYAGRPVTPTSAWNGAAARSRLSAVVQAGRGDLHWSGRDRRGQAVSAPPLGTARRLPESNSRPSVPPARPRAGR